MRKSLCSKRLTTIISEKSGRKSGKSERKLKNHNIMQDLAIIFPIFWCFTPTFSRHSKI